MRLSRSDYLRRNRRTIRDDLGSLTEICRFGSKGSQSQSGTGTSTTTTQLAPPGILWAQSPAAKEIMNRMLPVLQSIFPYARPTGPQYEWVNEQQTLPNGRVVTRRVRKEIPAPPYQPPSTKLYDLPGLDFGQMERVSPIERPEIPRIEDYYTQNLPSISDYYSSTAPRIEDYYTPPALPDIRDYYTPNLPEMADFYKPNAPNIEDYIAGGQRYQNVYNQIAPSMWDTYKQSVENPLIERFAGTGILGATGPGVSGAAMDALTGRRGEAENTISRAAYEAAQAPLLAGYQGALTQEQLNQQAALEAFKGALTGEQMGLQSGLAGYQGALTGRQQDLQSALAGYQGALQGFGQELQKGLTGFGGAMTGEQLRQQAGMAGYQGAMTGTQQDLQAALSEYASNQARAASEYEARAKQTLMPWQEQITQLQYPYQIFTGLLGGSMPQSVVYPTSGTSTSVSNQSITGGGGGGKK